MADGRPLYYALISNTLYYGAGGHFPKNLIFLLVYPGHSLCVQPSAPIPRIYPTHSHMACYPPYIHTLGDTISLDDITLLEDILSVLSLATVTALTTTILKRIRSCQLRAICL